MFFFKKMTAIRPQDRVLEIGPGSSPHRRSNAFLELSFDSNNEKLAQRGGVLKEAHFGNKPVHYYDGGKFPFQDRQFDYVICSHVVEHVTEPENFMNEVFRVGGGRGYLEYPLATYEYLYDFGVHLHFVKFDFERRVLKYLSKRDTSFAEFAAVSALFNKTLDYGWDDLCAANGRLFFEGFEFDRPFAVEKTGKLDELLPSPSLIVRKTAVRRILGRIVNKFGF